MNLVNISKNCICSRFCTFALKNIYNRAYFRLHYVQGKNNANEYSYLQSEATSKLCLNLALLYVM